MKITHHDMSRTKEPAGLSVNSAPREVTDHTFVFSDGTVRTLHISTPAGDPATLMARTMGSGSGTMSPSLHLVRYPGVQCSGPVLEMRGSTNEPSDMAAAGSEMTRLSLVAEVLASCADDHQRHYSTKSQQVATTYFYDPSDSYCI